MAMKGKALLKATTSRGDCNYETSRPDHGRRGARRPDQGRAGKAVEALTGAITDALKQGEEVRIAGFGTFAISERGERQGRNPQTGEQITIAAFKAAKFTASKAVKDALNGG